MRKILIALICCLCTAGCTLPLPLSESIMFMEERTGDDPPEDEPDGFPPGPIPGYPPRYGNEPSGNLRIKKWLRENNIRLLAGGGFTGNLTTTSITDYGLSMLPRFTEDEPFDFYDIASPDDIEIDSRKLGGSLGFGFAASDVFAVSMNFGIPVLSVDATLQPAPDYFVTVNHGLIDKALEIILQRKVIDGYRGGVAVGAYYRNDRYTVFDADAAIFAIPVPRGVEHFRVQSYGLRGSAQIALANSVDARFVATVGYLHEVEALISSLGFVLNVP